MRPSVAVHELKASHALLRDLNLWYRNNVQRLGIRNQAYFETRKVGGVFIVDQASADPGVPNVIPVPMDDDHFSIAKPETRESLLYKRVRGLVIHCAQETAEEQKRAAELPVEEGAEPIAAALGSLTDAELRRLLTKQLGRAEVGVVWFDTIGSGMDEELPGKSIGECVIELLLRSKQRALREELFTNLALERPDLI